MRTLAAVFQWALYVVGAPLRSIGQWLVDLSYRLWLYATGLSGEREVTSSDDDEPLPRGEHKPTLFD